MRKIREILRLKFEARLSHERIAAATGVSKGAVSNYVQRAVQRSLGWPLPEDLDEAALERLLFPQVVQQEQYTHADYAYVHQELKRKGVTLQLLWEEYRAAHGERAYRYSQFCWHYQRFHGSLARSMRQTHRAGEKLFIDYSGDTVPVINAATGEIGADLRRLDGGEQIHLCGSHLDAAAARLDRLARADVRAPRMRP
jgi:transposase